MSKNKIIIALVLLGLSVGSFAAERPNFLVLLTDDQKLDSLGCYKKEQPLPTPNIDKLAADGIRFNNGFVTTPICAISRACILTGRYSCKAGMTKFRSVMTEPVFENSYNMLLQNAGYYTGQLGKYGVRSTKAQIARFDFFDASQDQGPMFRNYKGKKLHDSAWLTQRTSDFLDTVPEGKPFCLQVNYKAPHASSCPAPEDEHLLDDYIFEKNPLDNEEAGMLVPEIVRNSFLRDCYYKDLYGGSGFNPVGGNYKELYGDGDPSLFSRQYYEKIASVERSVGKIRAMLEKRGLADNTVIIFLSDHGDHFGEKQLYGKWSPYEQSLRVPFIVYDPRPQAQKGQVRDEMVLNIDVAPTLLSLAGVKVPEVMDGRSLVPLVTRHSPPATLPWRSHFFFEHYHSGCKGVYIARNEGVRTVDAKYLRWIDPPQPIEEVYDLSKDPNELKNLVNSPEHQERVKKLRSTFDEWRQAHPANYEHQPGKTFNAPEIDWAKFKKKNAKDYKKIEAAVNQLGVSWEQATDDWETRKKIWNATKIYY